MLSIIIISSVSLILDLVLSNFLPFMMNDLSIFTTLFVVISLFFIYPLFTGNNKKYFIYIFIYGIIYDLMFTNLFFYHGFIFLFLGIITFYIYKNLEITFIRNIIYILFLILVYEGLFVIFILIFNLVPITLFKYLYKVSHTIISNVIYGELLYFIQKKLTKTTNKRRINVK